MVNSLQGLAFVVKKTARLSCVARVRQHDRWREFHLNFAAAWRSESWTLDQLSCHCGKVWSLQLLQDLIVASCFLHMWVSNNHGHEVFQQAALRPSAGTKFGARAGVGLQRMMPKGT